MKPTLLDAAKMRQLADGIAPHIPDGCGFTLIVFPFHAKGITNYISNANREDMAEALLEMVDTLLDGDDFQTPEPN